MSGGYRVTFPGRQWVERSAKAESRIGILQAVVGRVAHAQGDFHPASDPRR